MRRIIPIAIIAISLSGGAVNAQKQDEILRRFNTEGAGNWRTARPIAQEFAGSASGADYKALARAWPSIEKSAMRQELANAFLTTVHPDGLKVALLALEDKDPDVQKDVAQRITYTLGLPYTLTPEQLKAHIRPRLRKPLEEVRQERAREVVTAVRSAKPDAMKEVLDASRSLWNSKRLRQVATEAGLLDALRERFFGKGATAVTQMAVLEVLRSFDISDAFKTEILSVANAASGTDAEVQTTTFYYLASQKFRPAYEPLKAKLQRDASRGTVDRFGFSAAEALAKYGEPELIPLLIGVLASDNNESKYNIGYFALSPLTGVPYDAIHDGEWWKLWWETHKSELPEAVRSLPIPEFPRSPSYKEPLPRAVHADQEKFRAALITQAQDKMNQGTSANGESLAAIGGVAEIPTMIGLIASDNTYNSVYGIGYFGLTALTGVPYSPLHDGSWWKLWWDAHRQELPESVRSQTIPTFPQSQRFMAPLSEELHRNPDKLRESLIAELRVDLDRREEEAPSSSVSRTIDKITALQSLRAVPEIIPLLPEWSEKTSNTLYYLDYYGLSALTKVTYEKGRGKTWWSEWWQKNKTEWETRYTEQQPDFVSLTYRPGKPNRDKSIFVADCQYNPQVSPPAGQDSSAENPKDIADIPSVRQFAGGDKNKLYRLVGLDPKATAPEGGYSLLVILPGGDGSEEFRWFIRRIKKNALPKNMLVAQLVAPQWGDWQANNLVWPTRKSPFHGMKFPTEEFIEAAIADVKRQTKIDPKRVYTMAWSSSGPATYTHLATKGSSVAGAFIAMSVFRPNEIPDPASLAGKRVYLYHSPQDFIKIQQAQDAEAFLKAHGASVSLEPYEGGHGWRGDTFGAIQNAVEFLQAPAP